ncbi:MAG: hypothetical protein K0S76_2291 [Herbinix sp.]|jgi:hypothetical protein|nr:hypothetical protein [Herbinix sp.]
MNLRRRIKRTTKQYIIVAFICITVIGSAAIFTAILLTGQIRDEYSAKLIKAYDEMKMNQRNVYVALIDIMSGEVITEDNTEKKTVYASSPESIYLTEKDMGKAALIDISTGTPLLRNMFTENLVSSELREAEYNVININSNIISNDTVDVRIFYPNGESYVVLSKKVIKGYFPETMTCFLWMEEEELLRMSAAIVDAGLYPGSRLFVTKYIEPSIQQASDVTYTPSLSILTLLENNPNVIERYSQELNREIRKGLENRLADSFVTDVTEIKWDVDQDSYYGNGTVSLPKDETTQVSQQPVQKPDTRKTPLPNELPDQLIEDRKGVDTDTDSELGSDFDFYYYADEAAGKDEITYGN